MAKKPDAEIIDATPSTAVVVAAPTVPANVPASTSSAFARPEGMEDMPDSAFRVPRISITQPNNRRKGSREHTGEYYRSSDGSYFASMEAVILRELPNNTLWAGVNAKVPECVSHDGVTGSVYGACGSCQFNRFANEALNKRLQDGESAKHCNTGGTDVILVNTEDDEIGLLTVHGKSIKPLANLNGSYLGRGISFFAAPVTLTTVEETNDKGTYYVLRGKVGKAFKGDDLTEWRNRYRATKGVRLEIIEEDTEDDETAPSNDDEGGESGEYSNF